MAQDTCWTLIRSAASGEQAAREDFGRRYLPVVRSYLSARWAGRPLAGEVDDAVQEVFVRCYRAGGPLERADSGMPGGFQAYLRGICNKVALGAELQSARRRARSPSTPPVLEELPTDEERLTQLFDRAFAHQVMREARSLMAVRAEAAGAGAKRRHELLRLRFEEDLPIRAIAQRWREEGARLHHEYARARTEFHRALLDVVAFHHPGRTQAELEAGAAGLLDALM